ncbi:MAG: hypothetical protein JNM88_14035 [Chitinophagaceae bacterium]|nr:hypothetical protein [Chitinophagaceae bacterium]
MNYNITAAMIDAFAVLTESPDQSAPSPRIASAKEDRPAKPLKNCSGYFNKPKGILTNIKATNESCGPFL